MREGLENRGMRVKTVPERERESDKERHNKESNCPECVSGVERARMGSKFSDGQNLFAENR